MGFRPSIVFQVLDNAPWRTFVSVLTMVGMMRPLKLTFHRDHLGAFVLYDAKRKAQTDTMSAFSGFRLKVTLEPHSAIYSTLI